MGKGNAAVKQWLGNPRRFADLFNGIVFQGKQVILPEDLHPATGETDILVSDKNEKTKEVQRYRDIIMRWEQGAYLVLLACENQENVHYAMTVRNMLYDSLSYVEQIRQSWKQAFEKEKGEEQVDMCKALDDLYQDGIECGIEQGAVEVYQEMELSKEEVIERVQKKFSYAVEKAKEIVEKYWKE